MSEEVQPPGTYAPPVTPLIHASHADQLDGCLNSYGKSVSEVEKYNTQIIARDIQRDCEGKSSSEYRLMIWQAALSLNECALKESIICIVPLAAKVATGKWMPAEVLERIYSMLFSNQAWMSHQLRNNKRDKFDEYFLNSSKSDQVYVEDIFESQPTKKRRTSKLEDGYSKRPSKARKHSRKLLDQDEIEDVFSIAKQSDLCLTMQPAKSVQSVLSASGDGASSSTSHASGTNDTWKALCSMEETKARLTAPSSVGPSESLQCMSERSTYLSSCHPSSATGSNVKENAEESVNVDCSEPNSDGEDEVFWLHRESSDLYFATGIEI